MKTIKWVPVLVALAVFCCTTAWAAVEFRWSEKVATLGVGSMNGDAMFMILVDPNGTPTSGLIGQTEALANWTGSTAVTTLGTIVAGTWHGTAIDHERGGLETDVSAYNGFVYITGGATSAKTQNAGTDVTADLEEEAHASEHAVSGADTVFPADPGADRFLMWDDDPGALVWYDIGSLGYGDMLKATYDVSADGFPDGNDTAYGASWDNNINAASMNAVFDKIEALPGGHDAVTVVVSNSITLTLSTQEITADVNETWLAAQPVSQLDADESADGTLTALGQVHVRGDEDSYALHMGAGGEVAGEVLMSTLHKITLTFDPGAQYDSNSIIDLGPVLAKQYPNGIIIDYWEADCHLDPDVEMNLNLGYSVNSFDMADPNLIDVLDTTNGKSSEDTDANINGGSAVPAGVRMMLYFDADPEGTCTMFTFLLLYHGEED